MEYQLSIGDKPERVSLLFDKAESIGEVPPSLHGLTDFDNSLSIYFDSFVFLNNCRQSGMDANPISLQDIKTYMDELGITSSRLDFIYLIRQLDMFYLEHRRKNKPKGKK